MELFKRSPQSSEVPHVRARDREGTAIAMRGDASAEEVRWLQLDLTDEEEALMDRILEHEMDEVRNTPRDVRREQIRRALGHPALDQGPEA